MLLIIMVAYAENAAIHAALNFKLETPNIADFADFLHERFCGRCCGVRRVVFFTVFCTYSYVEFCVVPWVDVDRR